MRRHSVSRVVKYIRAVLEEDAVLGDVFVEGEISGLRAHSSEHLYFSLKDEEASLACIMFRGGARALDFAPKDGQRVVAWGRVSVYERSGSCQLVVGTLALQGIGALHLEAERLRRSLEEQGLFAAERKRPIPTYPSTIGIATSADGAALEDIKKVVRHNAPWCGLVLAPTRVQGDGVADEIATAIARLNAHGLADVLIVGRGGGSAEDLAAFNDEAVARAIFASKTPVISAVGHETDTSIADMVADLRAPTPSAAAHMATAACMDLPAYVAQAAQDMQSAADLKLREMRRAARSVLGAMGTLQGTRMAAAKAEAGRYAAALESLSPLQVLARGYSMVHDDQGRHIRSVGQMATGDVIVLGMYDGKATCVVEDICIV